MEDFIIKLPCGLTSQYKEIFNNQEKLTCPFCKNHIISREECLTKNELLIKEKNFELKKKNFIEFIEGYRMTNNDPKGCIGKTYENLKNQIFQRREKVKLIIENRMDDYYENLLERIEKEKKQKLNDFNDDLEQTLSLEQDLNNLIINNVTDLNSKIEIIDNYCDRIDKEIQILNSENKLNSNDWIFNEGDDNIEIENLFGNLECKGTTDQNIEKEKKYDFILTIDKFSCFKNFENSEIKSNIFNLKNLEWEISVKMNENTLNEKTLGFYLACNVSLSTVLMVYQPMSMRNLDYYIFPKEQKISRVK
ncbi:hypothetical protein BpHYR1_011997 [Brachionus plicatilis]|uniref:Ubiquitin carboxyl-terminal hydrolase 7 n=1 Tax=Brachionus plicatilis TaxID=10195 RepID=A0A3M7PXC0_BRAPC|nr:hypothetical protein BpHYR1_011997 [Brachionus plicatilis]